MYINTKTVA